MSDKIKRMSQLELMLEANKCDQRQLKIEEQIGREVMRAKVELLEMQEIRLRKAIQIEKHEDKKKEDFKKTF